MDLLSIDSLNDTQVANILDRAEHWFAENRAGNSSDGRMNDGFVKKMCTWRHATPFATFAVSLTCAPCGPRVQLESRSQN